MNLDTLVTNLGDALEATASVIASKARVGEVLLG